MTDRGAVRAALGDPDNHDVGRPPPDPHWEFVRHTRTAFVVVLYPFIHGREPFGYAERDGRIGFWFDPAGRVRRYAVWTGWDCPDDVRAEHVVAFEQWEAEQKARRAAKTRATPTRS